VRLLRGGTAVELNIAVEHRRNGAPGALNARDARRDRHGARATARALQSIT
jgi:hypothetical protein